MNLSVNEESVNDRYFVLSDAVTFTFLFPEIYVRPHTLNYFFKF